MNTYKLKHFVRSNASLLAGLTLGGIATATWVQSKARSAERAHPPAGRFVEVDGVRLHYRERGSGPLVLLIHGNMVTSGDFDASGLIERLAATHHVIAFDRPGFGHSSRPRDRLWTPAAQAALLHAALTKLGLAEPAVVLGHSMGTMVAVAYALDHSAAVQGLVLLGGYYFPSARIDALLTAPVALPVLGDAMRYTVTALASRAMLNKAVSAMFMPRAVPGRFFSAVPRELMLRPIQLRANAEDAAFMIPAAAVARTRHVALDRLPVLIMAGTDDLVVDPEAHSMRLHDELPHSELRLVRDTGHMVHYVAQDAITEVVADMTLEAKPHLQRDGTTATDA